MTPHIPVRPAPGAGCGPRAVASGALLAAACLIIAGCAGGAASSSGASSAVAGAGAPAARPAVPHAAAGTGGVKLAGVASQAIVYTASLTIRSRDLTRAAALAGQLATSAGGYVASEDTHLSPGHPGRSEISLQLKVPVSAYPATLGALSSGRLGTELSLSRRAQDVTQAVADVSSRVASARAAIAQLRALLGRAGSVASLLDVQDQINQEESGLEALQAQQRALTGQVSYATVSLLLEGRAAAVHHRQRASGFAAGLAAGWHAFTRVAAAAATGLGAALPFLIVIAVLGLGGYRVWRWRLGRRAAKPGTTG